MTHVFFHGPIKYNYLARHLAHRLSMMGQCSAAQLRLIIDLSSVPSSFTETQLSLIKSRVRVSARIKVFADVYYGIQSLFARPHYGMAYIIYYYTVQLYWNELIP